MAAPFPRRTNAVARGSLWAIVVVALGLPLVLTRRAGFTMTFASFDWMMSLTPRWYSTAYGLYWFAGGMTGALGLLALLARSDAQAREAAGSFQALGRLMLTFVMFWVYIGFAQYIVIWSANITLEVAWHAPRTHGAWGGVALAILIGASLTFLALLTRAVRGHSALVAALGALLLVLG